MSLINALVLFVGTQAIAYIHSKGSTPSASTIAYTAHMDIFQHLLVDLDTEGKCKWVIVCYIYLYLSEVSYFTKDMISYGYIQSWGNLVTCNLSYVIFVTF